MAEIYVPWGGKEIANLSDGTILYTPTIEACLAVCGLQGRTGALMHLRATDPIQEYLTWFKTNLVPGSATKVALIGAMRGRGEGLLENVGEILIRDGFNIDHERVLTDFAYDLYFGQREISLIQKRQMRTGNELEYVPIGEDKIIF